MRTLIEIENKPNVYGWSAKVEFILGREINFPDFEDPACLLWNPKYILTLNRIKIASWLKDAGMSGYQLTIAAEDTARGAELLGVRLAFGLLAIGVERRWGLTLSWQDSPLPCRVIDRTAPLGSSMSAFLDVTKHMSLNDFICKLETGFARHNEVPYKTLLSMELFCSSQMESNSRSKLIMLTSALEALATQKDLESEIGPVIKKLLDIVDGSITINQDLKPSLKGQIKNLKRESARKAIQRLAKESGLTSEDILFVDDAYSARSQIVHEGKRVPELGATIAKLERILVQIYEQQ